jgi:histidine triad (HIT) family protein
VSDAPIAEPGCLFCRVVAGELPADVVRTAERTLAFRDIAPQAPTHVLVVTRDHHPDLGALVAADPGLAATLVADAVAVADQEALVGGYRLVVNTGQEGGQTVGHVHVHVLGGRHMTWPPG